MITYALLWMLENILMGLMHLFPRSTTIAGLMPDGFAVVIAGIGEWVNLPLMTFYISAYLTIVGLWGIVMAVNKIINVARGSG